MESTTEGKKEKKIKVLKGFEIMENKESLKL